MKTAKFWLVQIVMVAIVSLAFGSPVFADKSDAKDQKWHEKLEKKFNKKMEKHPEKADKWQEKYDKKLAKHNAKHHADDPGPVCSQETPELCNPDTCVEPIGIWFNGMCMFF